MSLLMQRIWAMPSADTFDVEPIGSFVRKYLRTSQVSIDPFSRNRHWATFTNDLNPETSAESHLEAAEFLASLKGKGIRADLVIFDPPYSLEQCARAYQNVGRHVTMRDTQIFGRWTEHKEICADLLEDNGIFLHFGWHSNGMGLKHGFELIECLVVAHGGAHNDTICIAERKRPKSQELLQFAGADEGGKEKA